MAECDHGALLSARRQARAEIAERLGRLRGLHLALAADRSGFPTSSLESARARLALWESRKLCSAWYLDRWRRILEIGPSALVEALDGPDGGALLQNSPFFVSREDLTGKDDQ